MLALVASPFTQGRLLSDRLRRIFVLFVNDCYRFLCRGFLDYARNDIGVCEVCWCGYESDISFPRDCRASLAMTATKRLFVWFYKVNICRCGHRRLARRGSLPGGRGRPPLHSLTDSLDCHAITPLLPFPTSYALRGLGHSRKCPSGFFATFFSTRKK